MLEENEEVKGIAVVQFLRLGRAKMEERKKLHHYVEAAGYIICDILIYQLHALKAAQLNHINNFKVTLPT